MLLLALISQRKGSAHPVVAVPVYRASQAVSQYRAARYVMWLSMPAANGQIRGRHPTPVGPVRTATSPEPLPESAFPGGVFIQPSHFGPQITSAKSAVRDR
jgi:hypothetical protein